MVSAASALRMAARRCQQCRITTRPVVSAVTPFRAFSASAFQRREMDPELAALIAEVTKEIEEAKESPSEKELTQLVEDTGEIIRSEEVRDDVAEFTMSIAEEEDRRRKPILAPKYEVKKQGLMAMGEEPGEGQEDPEFEEDDITSIAHGQLEQHREYREYMRIAAWEMPLLSKMAKPFVPPNSKQILRFRYTTYMGESHPAEKKVVVEFTPEDLPDMTPVQKLKLKKLAGVRYNPETDIIKMSSEMFDTQAQNKRYLGDLVDTLIKEAKDPKDTFEDIPLDTRHHKLVKKPKFPKEWRMTPERKAELEEQRKLAEEAERLRQQEGLLLDGKAILAQANEEMAKEMAKQAMEAPVQQTKGKKATNKR